VALWSRSADAPGEALKKARRMIGVGMAAGVAFTVILCAWALHSGGEMQTESEELASRIRSLQRQVQVARGAGTGSGPNALAQAWSAKEKAPSAVIMLEALSRALPDMAYLTDLNIEGPTLRITGLTSDGPSLIAPLESSGHFADVRFFAPTTRSPDGTLFRFYIEARIQPRLRVASQ
jgi:general secretion pathway protein L